MARKITREVPVDKQTAVGWIKKPDGYETFYVKYLCAGQWNFQHMSWSCRGSRRLYYRAMVALYKMIRRARLTPFDLHYLAGTTVMERYNRQYLLANKGV
jgi:hypothetical protein